METGPACSAGELALSGSTLLTINCVEGEAVEEPRSKEEGRRTREDGKRKKEDRIKSKPCDLVTRWLGDFETAGEETMRGMLRKVTKGCKKLL